MNFLKRFLGCCLPVLLTGATAWAQEGANSITSNKTSELSYISQQLAAGKGYRTRLEAQGTPLLLPYWTQGWVQTSSQRHTAVWLKYDLAGNMLLWRRPAGDSITLDVSQIKSFALGDSLRDTRSTFQRYPDARSEDPTLNSAFLEVLYDAGRTGLLCRRTKQLSSGTTSPSLSAPSLPTWRNQTQYYIKKRDNLLVPVRLTPKAVLAVLGSEQSDVLSAYTKREHLSLKRAPDVAKLLAYYDTL